jgi:hypothetical protein
LVENRKGKTGVNGEITLILILNTIEGCEVAFVNTVMNVRFPWGIS